MAAPRLTPRQLDVVRLLVAGEGLSVKEIAAELEISESTVKVHLARVRRRLNVRTNAAIGARIKRDDLSTERRLAAR